MRITPSRDITAAEIEQYQREGFVKLENIISLDWIDLLRETIEEMVESGVLNSTHYDARNKAMRASGANILSDADGEPTGRFFMSNDKWREVPNLRKICLHSPLPAIAAQLFRSSKINYLIDQVFMKEAGSLNRTAFHSDESYFNCTGEKCATFWIPVDVVDRANGAMGYVPRSHLWHTPFKRNVFLSQDVDPTSTGEQIPDIEGNEAKYGVVYLESAPGDILIHHYRTLHGSTGNVDSTRVRRAGALRYGGEDLRYFERMPNAMVSRELQPGDPMDSAAFPVVWDNGPVIANSQL